MAGSSYATASRRKILEYLKNSNDHTVTAADVDEYLKKHDSEVNITTITAIWTSLQRMEL